MEYSRQRGPEAASLPSIFIAADPPSRFRHGPLPTSSPTAITSAMSIPGAQRPEEVPPALPPPQFPFGKPRNSDYKEPRPGSFASFSSREPSLFGSFGNHMEDHRGGPIGRVDRDEGYASLSSTRSKDSLPTGFGAYHNQYKFQTSADNYCDNMMKNKLNPLRTFENRSPTSQSLHSPSTSDFASYRLSPESRLPPLAVPVSLPLRPYILEEPERYSQTPISSTASPRHGPYSLHSRSPRSPGGNSDVDYSLRRQLSGRTNSMSLAEDSATSPRGAYDMDSREDVEIAETSSMRRLHIDDASREYHMAGLKRRASSPPVEEPMLHSMASQGDLRRRELSRGSPTPRLTVMSKGSVSSISSNGRSGSFTSTFSVGGAAGATGANSYGRHSPVGRSPGGASSAGAEPNSITSYPNINPSPRGSISRSSHAQPINESRPIGPLKVGEAGKGSGQRMQGFILMCECCPKKPKKFETREELAAHAAEKQYECSFCGNRFKNKNEAERHQNSLHVRRHSWSCKALTSYPQAFHESSNRPGEADTCGYCGRDFNRTGPVAAGGVGRVASDQDWDERIQHLTADHKFRECNSSKKFFRADHFRQHLKHSHAGSSGKWTNMLENACMMEEDTTPK